MRQKIKRARPQPANAGVQDGRRRRRNAAEAQVIVPQQVDLPLPTPPSEEIKVPASVDGRSLSNGRP